MTNTLTIDHFNQAAQFKEVADLNGFEQRHLCGGQRDVMLKSTQPEIILGQGHFAQCEVKRYEKVSIAPLF